MKIAQILQPEQLKQLMKRPEDAPVVMVNLLEFNAPAEGVNEGMSGGESNRKYGEPMNKFAESKGGRFIWSGRVDSMVVGESDSDFDAIALVETPSRKGLVEIATTDYVAAICEDRKMGLEGSG
jgi:hypothetical protein